LGHNLLRRDEECRQEGSRKSHLVSLWFGKRQSKSIKNLVRDVPPRLPMMRTVLSVGWHHTCLGRYPAPKKGCLGKFIRSLFHFAS
jgi:hypothetical protein